MRRSRKLEGDDLIAVLMAAYPPPRVLKIEGIPRIRWDQLIDLGYDVYYCKTTSLPELRRRDDHVTQNEGHLSAASKFSGAVGSWRTCLAR